MKYKIVMILFVLLGACSSCEKGKGAAALHAQKPLSPQEGKALYMKECARCHGSSGDGSGHAPALALPKKDARSNEKLTEIIGKGRGGMPAFGKRFGKHEMDAIIGVIRGFEKP